MKSTMQVQGIKETLRELNQIDPKLRRQITKEFKKIGAPVVQEAQNMVPQTPPLSGWGRVWQTPGSRFQMLPWDDAMARKMIDTKVSSKRPREYRGVVRDLAVVAIRWRGAVNTVFDMSRDPETPQGAVMIDGLNNRYGRASRIMWPAMEKHKDTVENEIEQQVRIVQAAVARSVK
jgi:hypothetical protein